MFSNTFLGQLENLIGSRVEIATDNNLVEGILGATTNGLVVLIQTGGYGLSLTIFISPSSINFLRILNAA